MEFILVYKNFLSIPHGFLKNVSFAVEKVSDILHGATILVVPTKN